MNEYKIFETLFDMIPFGIYVANMDTYEVVYLNSIFRSKFGEDLKEKKCYELIYGFDAPCFFCTIDMLRQGAKPSSGKPFILDLFNELDDRWYRLEDRAIYWPDGSLVKYSIAIDITDQKLTQNSLSEAHARLMLQSRELEQKNALLQDMYEKAKSMAEKDYLTDLYNRRFFYEIGTKMFSSIARQNLNAYIAVLDIDWFKRVNDTYGHLSGDMVLKHFAEILKNSFRKSDLIGRIGGEEFAIILVDLEAEKARGLFEKLRREVQDSTVVLEDGRTINYTISIGAAKVEGVNMDLLISTADNLMYLAKKQGRNSLVFEHAMTARG